MSGGQHAGGGEHRAAAGVGAGVRQRHLVGEVCDVGVSTVNHAELVAQVDGGSSLSGCGGEISLSWSSSTWLHDILTYWEGSYKRRLILWVGLL